MGITHSKITLKSTPTSMGVPIVLMVDSGADYSVVPKSVLQSLGIEPRRRVTIVLADGTRRERMVGDLYYQFEDLLAPAPVIFGEDGDEPMLGVVTLEALGLLLDPLRRMISRRETLRM